MFHKPPSSSDKMQTTAPPPWQVLDLISPHLDPQTLAAASCVSKTWSTSLSADHLWLPICSAAFPSLTTLRAAAPLPYRKIYSLGRAAATRRLQPPPKPLLSLPDLLFTIDIHNNRRHVTTVVAPADHLNLDKNGVFRFDIEVDHDNAHKSTPLPIPESGTDDNCNDNDDGDDKVVGFEEVDDLRVTWNVVLKGFKGVFGMMDCSGRGSFVLGLEGWFSKELPSPGCCCSGGGGSGMVAELRVGMKEGGGGGRGKVVVEKMSVGVLSVVSWRYVCVDDALRYLQHFLLHAI